MRKSAVHIRELKNFWKVMKTFQGNTEFLNNLIYEIRYQFPKKFYNAKLNFIRSMKRF